VYVVQRVGGWFVQHCAGDGQAKAQLEVLPEKRIKKGVI
jgi:hypothetical protein